MGMKLDPENAMATVSLNGLALYCINKDRMCEYGLLKVRDHTSTFDVQASTVSGDAPTSTKVSLVNLGDDLIVGVVAPEKSAPYNIGDFIAGVEFFQNDEKPFNRRKDEGDPYDFRWALNLEGPDFGGRKLKLVNDDAEEDPISIFPRIFIASGTIYTKSKSLESYSIIQPKAENFDTPVAGRIAFEIGIEIPRGNHKLVIGKITNGGKVEPLTTDLPNDPTVKYTVRVDNNCSIPQLPDEGTDLQLFYRLLRYPDETERPLFDLQRVVPNGGNGTVEDQIASTSDFSLDSYPYFCRGGFLGQTDGLEV
jgi:hypothetical protein